MTKPKRKIALIYGGEGREHPVSVKSAEYALTVIDREKYELLPVYITEGGEWLLTRGGERCETFPIRRTGRRGLLLGGEVVEIDCAIPLLHGDYGEDGRVQGALEVVGIPFVGASTVTGAICADKGYTRLVAESVGIPVAKGAAIDRETPYEDALAIAKELGFPVFIKPAGLGSSIGACAARTEEELYSALKEARALDGRTLIEELITPKRELEVGILVTREGVTVSPIGEVLCEGFYSYERKYRGGTRTVCPAQAPKRIVDILGKWVVRLARALSIRGPARMDFFLSGDRLLFNEVNTMPGFTADSLYPRLMQAAGIDPTRLFDLLIEDAVGG